MSDGGADQVNRYKYTIYVDVRNRLTWVDCFLSPSFMRDWMRQTCVWGNAFQKHSDALASELW